MRRSGYPLTIPDELLNSEAMRRACATRNFQELFRLVNRRTGSSQADMAAAIGKMTSARIGDVIRGVRRIRGQEVIERIADGFGIPGEMLDLPKRLWEEFEESSDGASTQGEVASVDRRAFVYTSASALTVGPLASSQLNRSERTVQALKVVGSDNPSAIVDSLGELIDHYSMTVCAVSPESVYDEILTVRSYANRILGGAAARQRKDMALAVGWLSCLLGIAACDMAEHAAAHVWCADAERRSQEAAHPELTGWATLTRSMIAFYQGQSRESANLASRGQAATPTGTVVHAKLAAQEMRAAALTGDADSMEKARLYATKLMSQLPPGVKSSGAFSIAVAEDPPYTATSLMLLGRFAEAVPATNRVLQTHYRPAARQSGNHPSGYARALLILGLAQAGAGHLDEAVSAGKTALAGNRTAWPTAVLAGRLCQALERDFADARQTGEYRSDYLELTTRMTGSPTPPERIRNDRRRFQ